jgi:2-polyprenyl-3-methyl-5-hydroxy-6-metoxy-1,4-benzoquinol methylase
MVCPWWLGYFLISPYRKKRQDPEKILEPYIKPGMKVVDFGSAMGFFSIPLASLVGDSGKVYCLDIQEKMLNKLMKRAVKFGVNNIIETKLIDSNENIFNELSGKADFILLFAVAHEVPDKEKLFNNLFKMMKRDGIMLFSEPTGHVKKGAFEISLSIAEKSGFIKIKSIDIKSEHSMLFTKN